MVGIVSAQQTFAGTGIGTWTAVSLPLITYQPPAGLGVPMNLSHQAPGVWLEGGGGATIKIQVSRDGGVSFFDMWDEDGTPLSFVLASAAAVRVGLERLEDGCVYRANCTAYTAGTPKATFSQ